MELLFVLKNAALELNEKKDPPKEFRIWAFGEVESTKGTFLFDKASAESVMARFNERGIDMGGDYEHASTQDKPPPEGAPSPLWCKLAVREDGLWAVDVKWTPRALDYLKNGEIRYFSPAFFANRETKRISRLHNIALTNDPATLDAEPLVAATALDRRTEFVALSLSFDQVRDALGLALRGKYPDQCAWVCDVYDDSVVFSLGQKIWQAPYVAEGSTAVIGDPIEVQRTYTPVATGAGEGETTMKTVLKNLGLPETSTEAEALVALTTIQKQRTDADAELVALTGTKSRSEALGAVAAWKTAHEQVTTLSARVQELEAASNTREVEQLIEAGVRDGKIPPAMKDSYTEMGKKDLVMLKSFIEKLPKLITTSATATKPPPGEQEMVTLSDEEKAMAKRMNISEADLLETKKTNATA